MQVAQDLAFLMVQIVVFNSGAKISGYMHMFLVANFKHM